MTGVSDLGVIRNYVRLFSKAFAEEAEGEKAL